MTSNPRSASRTVRVDQAMRELLDHIARIGTEPDGQTEEVLATGIGALDDLLGGGLKPGGITLLDPNVAPQGRAILYTVARRLDVPRLLAAATILDGSRWLLAGAAGVPAEFMRIGLVDEDDGWVMGDGVRDLVGQEISIADVDSAKVLSSLMETGDWRVLLIDDLARFAPVTDALATLRHIGRVRTHCAVLATFRGAMELPSWASEETARVTVVSQNLGARAALVTTEEPGGFTARQVEMDCFTADAWTYVDRDQSDEPF